MIVSTPRGGAFRRSLFACCAAAALAVGTPGLAQTISGTTASQPVAFAIESQPLEKALTTFARVADVQVLYAPALVRGKTAGRAVGVLSPADALRQILGGTGLSATSVGQRTFSLAATATASDGAATELEEVIVTGFRSSVANARNARRNANGLQDSIFAEDIGDFPDLNLAEALQRVPGVSITRDAGEGRQISVRGLNGDYTRVRLNGLEALATTGTTDQRGAVNRSRSFDFNVFASELFTRVDVIKSPSARIDEGGIGGTVDLQTARPFDFDGFVLSASGQAYYSERMEEVQPRAAFLVSNTTEDGKFGALFSAAYTDRSIVEDGHQTIRWQSGGWNLANVSSSIPADVRARLNGTGADRLFYPRTPRYFIFQHDQERIGLTGALQWRPTDRLSFDLDALHATFDAERREHFLDAQSFTRTDATGIRETTIRSLTVQGNDIVAADFGNVDNRLDARLDTNTTEFSQLALRGRWEATDRLSIEAMIGTQGSDFEVGTRTLQFVSPNNDFAYDYTQNDRVPLMRYGALLNDPSDWNLDLYRPRLNTVENNYEIAKLDAEYDLGGVTLKAGISHTDYRFETAEFGQDQTTLRGRQVADIVTRLPYEFGVSLDLPASAPTRWIVPDLDRAFGTLNLNGQTLTRNVLSDRAVQEKVSAAYAQMDFETRLLGRPLRGDLGVRYARTEVSATGVVSVGATPTAVTIARDYGDTLPSLNLVWEVADDIQLRLGANRNITRPTLTSLTPGGSVSITTRTVTVGNPDLNPFEADSVDLTAEWYLGSGLLAVGPFYKSISSFIVNQTTTQPYQDSGFPVSLLGDQSQARPTDLFAFTQPVNGSGTDLYGMEVVFQQDLDFLPGFLANTGVLLNYTYSEAEVDYVGPTVGTGAAARVTIIRAPLVGLSEHAANATVYYETDVWGARLAVNYRDGYLTSVPSANGNDVSGTNAATYVDASAFWKLTPQIEVSVEGLNLSNEAEDQYVDSSDRPNSYAKSGRQFLVGVKYRF